MSAKSPIDTIKFARDLAPGDVIETGEGYPADLLTVHHFKNEGTVLLKWGQGQNDGKIVTEYTGIVFLGHWTPVIDV